MGNRGLVSRYAGAIAEDDFDGQDDLIHDDYVLEFPQSGERFRGRANRRFIFEQYPGRKQSGNRPEIDRITGTDDKFIPTASGLTWSVIHLTGSGDEFSVTGTIRYPDGQSWHFVSLLQVRDGKVWRESTYFALPFDAPDWRSEAREAP